MLPARTPAGRLWVLAGVGTAYCAAAWVGLLLRAPGGPVAVWPPAGIALAAVLSFGLDASPAIAAAALVTGLFALPHTAAGVIGSAALALVNTFEPVATVFLLRRVCGDADPFTRSKHAMWFAACVLACALIAAAGGTAVLRFAGFAPRTTLATWWVADLAAMLIIAPALTVWTRSAQPRLPTPRLIEFGALALLTVVLADLLFSGRVSPRVAVTRPFVPLLIWAAFRFGPRETATFAALMSLQAIGRTWFILHAPLDRHASNVMSFLFVDAATPAHEWLRTTQVILCTATVLTFIVASAVEERAALETALRDANRSLEERVNRRTAALAAVNHQLEAQIGDRRRIEVQLRASLDEKETLLREVHHRVKNNLAIVSSLLYLEAAHAGDDRAAHVLQDSQHRIRSMAMVHEKLYRSGDLAAVNFRDYLEALLDYLVQSHPAANRVTVRKHVDALLLDADTAVPCGLIVTELVTNSLKHAFPDNRAGTISIDLRAGADRHHHLTVEDDGVGPRDGAKIDTASTLGWRLMRALARQIDGTLTVRPAAPGLEARLSFPMRQAVHS